MNTISNSWMQSPPGNRAGFGAALMIMLFAFGAVSLALVATSAAATHADSVERARERTQSGLDERACSDSVALVRSKDVFAAGNITIPEFGCQLHL